MEKVTAALKRLYGVDIPGEAEVVDIVLNDDGEPEGVVMPRTGPGPRAQKLSIRAKPVDHLPR